MRVIDSHQHFWRYSPEEYDWIDGSMEKLRTDFLPVELQPEMASARVDACVAVQARQTVEETEWLLDLAATSPFIAGVVGWAPIAAPEFPAILAQIGANPVLKGLRHIVQAELQARFLLQSAFRQGIREITRAGLVYDILILPHQLPQAIEFVDEHPQQSFVLDHAAKPPLRSGDLAVWERDFRALARRENVCCKLSGLVTEADWNTWTEESLRPVFDIMVESFTPQRMMAGSDWPVCTVATNYDAWWSLLRRGVAKLSDAEQTAVLGGTAERIYKL
ncbi:amidohydrolase family protein [Terriglobus saanensis]|uniref:Amidohydrolase 2 n=1 Tax=Terriglobus saanensis (strain ATCC BAA-1853 / DSM 23119 / SP1PR4) TaxID=401053 RepID=E8UWZ5_TERSS|nr:amidohydrolase family protein [Terriglobus saanensis]ADV81882.1 amidohydrolase 2 [Terriglobus saanensis SP1PR4]